MPQEATFQYVHRKEMVNQERGNTVQYVCINPSTEEVNLVYVHVTQSNLVHEDKKAKTISFDVNFLTKFRAVEFTGNVKVLRFSNPNAAPMQRR